MEQSEYIDGGKPAPTREKLLCDAIGLGDDDEMGVGGVMPFKSSLWDIVVSEYLPGDESLDMAKGSGDTGLLLPWEVFGWKDDPVFGTVYDTIMPIQ